MEIVAGFLLGGEHRVQVGNHRDGFLSGPRARQHQVIAEFGIGGAHLFGGKAKRRETFGRKLCQTVYPGRVAGKTVDFHHLPQHLQRLGQSPLQIFSN